jgi:predicted negative regulator of RcsB-dependent stress response
MADEYLSDNEREEALKEWWRDNWSWILGGVVLGVALLIGWRYWEAHRKQRAEDAAEVYSDIQTALNARDVAKAQELLNGLVAESESGAYTQQARLLFAKVHVEAGKFDDAEPLLRAVADQSKDKELAGIAQLRLGRLLVQAGKHEEALKLLEPLTAGAFGAQAREIRGDALFVKGDAEGARAEYAAALAEPQAQLDRATVELKLQDVGGVAATAQIPAPEQP